MAKLDGHELFAALTALLGRSKVDAAWSALPPSLERLRIALTEAPRRATTIDLAVLLRQALRFEHARRNYAVTPTVFVAHERLAGFEAWERLSMRAIPAQDGQHVTALPWRPDWLPNSGEQGVDALAASEAVRREFNTANCEGDPFLASVGRESYRSRGQRAAVRAALSTPANGTLAVALPTGEGKSMIFQLVQSIGFVGAGHVEGRGVTLVIVPTVALAVNHEAEAVSVCGLSKPLAFQGGSDVENGIIANRIAEGSQGLCFASPEAACGRLRDPLHRAAEAGHLRALVLDEAHLVDQWGTGFRTEFQELSGLRRELIAAAPPQQRMRTLLLSATLTESSLETLRTLFGTDGDFESIAAVQLRPEPDYWIAPVASEQQRIDRVVEALYHAPRPAVLYVTEVAEAVAWRSRLIETGFGRLRTLHGKTPRREREDIVRQWRDGLVDIVVGTSAFGLGIDYPHARTVLHACVPETLDRFYQEVGRGGRDGKASLSLISPTPKDFITAKRINAQKVISVGRGLQRWTTMFARKQTLADGGFAVRIDGRPGAGEQDIDMFGEANTDWNLRTVALMARAGLLRLLGTPNPRVEQDGDWLRVEIIDDHHLDPVTWQQRVKPVRRDASLAGQRNLDLMRSFLDDQRCPAEILEELYGSDRIGRACSRCSRCRANPANRRPTVTIGEPRGPWVQPLYPPLARLFDLNLRLLVTYEPDKLPRAASRRLSETLQRLRHAGLAKLVILGDQPFDMPSVLKFAEKAPFFVSKVSSLALSRLPGGPELVLVGRDQRLEEQNLAVRQETPRIFFTPLDQDAPDGRPLRDVFGGRKLTLDEFHARVSQ
jgi:ATP-dependent DNA helicase RecQ